jgi:hypothetical protein
VTEGNDTGYRHNHVQADGVVSAEAESLA